MNLVYNIQDKPKLPQLLIFALQQVLAILAATIAVPTIIGPGTELDHCCLRCGDFGGVPAGAAQPGFYGHL